MDSATGCRSHDHDHPLILLDVGRQDDKCEWSGAKEDDAPVLHLYSDGDLDSANILPRPVVVSQKQLQIRVKSAVDLWQLKETDRVLSCLPAPHEAVVVDGTEAPLSVGGQICLPTSYGVWDLWKYYFFEINLPRAQFK